MDKSLLLSKDNLRVRSCRRGIFTYFVNDVYIGRSLDKYGEYSEGEIDLFSQIVKTGMTVVEVGANIGTHTAFFGAAVGDHGLVVAFEPQPPIFRLLCANMALNNLMNVTTYQVALSAEAGTLTVPPVDYRQIANFGGVELKNQSAKGTQVPVTTLDSYELTNCHLIKVDVEGMELDVLKGATRTIEKFRPLLYIENDRREKSAALVEYILRNNYKIYWHTPFMFKKNNFLSFKENIFPNLISVNIVCFPEELRINAVNLKEIRSPEEAVWRHQP